MDRVTRGTTGNASSTPLGEISPARTSSQKNLPRHQKLDAQKKEPPAARTPLFALNGIGSGPQGGLRLSSTSAFPAGDLDLLLPLLKDAGIDAVREGDHLVLWADKKVAHACVARIDDAITLLKVCGIRQQSACGLLVEYDSLWKACSGPRGIEFRQRPGGLKLRGRQDIVQLQDLFRELVSCGQPHAALRLLKAAPSSVLLKCLLQPGDPALANLTIPADLRAVWTAIVGRAAGAAARQGNFQSLCECFDATPPEQKSAFATLILPKDVRNLPGFISDLAVCALENAHKDDGASVALLDLATRLFTLASESFQSGDRAAIQKAIYVAMGKLERSPDVYGEIMKRAGPSVLNLVHLTVDPTGSGLTKDELLVQIGQLRQFGGTAFEQLGELELAYVQSVSEHLAEKFQDSLGPSPTGQLQVRRARTMEAADAIVSLAEFAVSSSEPGMLAHGRLMLEGLPDLVPPGLEPEKRQAFCEHIEEAVRALEKAVNTDAESLAKAHGRLLGLLQLAIHPAGANLTLEELRNEVEKRRRLVADAPAGFENLAREQLAGLESDYIEAAVTHLEEEFDYKLMLQPAGPLLAGMPTAEAAQALLALAEFQIESLDRGLASKGEDLVEIVARRVGESARTEKLTPLEVQLDRLEVKRFVLRVVRDANSGKSAVDAVRAARQAGHPDPLPEAFATFLAAPPASEASLEVWAELARDYLGEVLRALKKGNGGSDELRGLVASHPDVRNALEVLGQCYRNSLRAFLRTHVPEESRVEFAAAVFATPTSAQGVLVEEEAMNLAALDRKNSDAEANEASSLRFRAFAASVIACPGGAEKLVEYVTLKSEARPDAGHAEYDRRSLSLQAAVNFVAKSQPADAASTKSHLALVRHVSDLFAGDPLSFGLDADFSRMVQSAANQDRLVAIGYLSPDVFEVLEKIAGSIATDVNAALLQVAQLPQEVVSRVVEKLLAKNWAEPLQAAVNAALESGDRKALDELCINLRNAGRTLQSPKLHADLLATLASGAASLGASAVCNFCAAAISSGSTPGSVPTERWAGTLAKALADVPRHEIKALLGRIHAAALADPSSLQTFASILNHMLQAALRDYKLGLSNYSQLISALMPLMKELKPHLTENIDHSIAAKSLATSLSIESVLFQWNVRRQN
jgi:hypothetical protein